MMKRVYTCDICKDGKSPGQLIGCNFVSTKKFHLTGAYKTDGTHICKDCLTQISVQAGNVGICQSGGC